MNLYSLNSKLYKNLSSPLLAQASFACAFWIYTNIYFQHKRGRLRYRMVVYQEANAIYKLIHIKNPPHFFSAVDLFSLF